jgi:TolB-like protein/lipopolysaccharide biosynthesis regulator YciM
MSRFTRLLRELERRRVVRVAAVYAVVAFVVWQAADIAFPALRLPEWTLTLVVALTLLGFPIALVLAWAFDVTPSGVKRTEPRAAGAPARERSSTLVTAAWLTLFAVVVVAVGWIVLARGQRQALESGDQQKLVVLPFENLGAPEDEYFADGLTDEITARLADLQGLEVKSRQSAYAYKHSQLTAQQIGAELDVAYILEGTVQRERPGDPASRVRVIPQLIRVADDAHVWADTYDDEMSEIFRVQSEIAEQVAQALDITLLEPERRSLRQRPTQNLEAYEHYLRGNESWRQSFWPVAARAAADAYARAVELDPEFAVAYAALARARVWLYFRGLSADLSSALAVLDEATRLGPELVETQMARGYYHYYGDQDYERALEVFRAALRRQPNNAEALGIVGAIHRRQGVWDAAIASVERAVELDPRNQLLVAMLARTYEWMRRHREAERHWDRLIAIEPRNLSFYAMRANNILLAEGDIERARGVLRDASSHADPAVILVFARVLLRLFGDEYAAGLDELSLGDGSDTVRYFLAKAELNARRNITVPAQAYYDSARAVLEGIVGQGPAAYGRSAGDLAVAYAGLGRAEEAAQVARRAVERYPVSVDAVLGVDLIAGLAEVYTMIGDYDAAIEQLEYLLSVPSLVSVSLLRVDPLWDPLRGHPRFDALLEEHE